MAMPSLRDHLLRTPYVQPRSFALSVAPILGERRDPYRTHLVEESALRVLAAVYQQTGVLREQLVFERQRFDRLVQILYRLPEREGGET
jgi:hypothetical protein